MTFLQALRNELLATAGLQGVINDVYLHVTPPLSSAPRPFLIVNLLYENSDPTNRGSNYSRTDVQVTAVADDDAVVTTLAKAVQSRFDGTSRSPLVWDDGREMTSWAQQSRLRVDTNIAPANKRLWRYEVDLVILSTY